MHRSLFRLRAFFCVALLGSNAASSLATPFLGGPPVADPAPKPLGGPIASSGQANSPAKSRATSPLVQRPTIRSSAATKPPSNGDANNNSAKNDAADEGKPFYPGVTYSDASEKATVAGQPAPALGPAPYDLSLIKRVAIGGQLLPQAPLRVGNLDVLSPFVDQIGALGVSVSRADPRNVPGNLNAPGENQYFQINFPSQMDPATQVNRPKRPPIVFTIGKSTAYVDGNEQPLRAAPLVIDGQIFLPVFSIAPLVGAAARLDNSGNLVLTPTIQSVELFPIKDTVAVTIQASAPLTSRNIKIVNVAAEAGSSAKVYLDFEGFSMGFDAGNSTIERMVAPGAGDVLRARAGMPSKFPDTTRIVLDLKRPLRGMPQSVPDTTIFALRLAPQGTVAPPISTRVFTDPMPGDRTGANPIPPKPAGKPAANFNYGPSLRGLTIVVDAGHGGHDTGARGRASLEKAHTLDISRRLRANLQARGANVLMTRDTDNFITLQGRVDFANNRRADLFVSVHINASPNPASTGTETFYYTAISQSLAREVQKELLKATGRPNRGIEQRRFFVVRYTAMPSVLTETAFISNSKEEALLRRPEYRERVARGIAQGVANYISIYGRPGLSG